MLYTLWMGFHIDRTPELSRHVTGVPRLRGAQNIDPEGLVIREFCPQRILMACMVIPTWGALGMNWNLTELDLVPNSSDIREPQSRLSWDLPNGNL